MAVSISHPLRGQTILVTRAASQASAFTQQLQRAGATVLEMPTLEIGPPQDWQAMDQALQHLDTFDWLILTSHNGVHFFFQRLQELGLDSRALGTLKIAVVGEKTAQTLSHHGLRPDFVPPAFIADALIAHFPVPVAGLSILFPRVETGGRPVLGEAFRAAGAQVMEVAAYESRCPTQVDSAILRALEQQQIHLVTFTSSKTVRHFCQLLGGGDRTQELLNQVKIASIGPQTSQTCQTLLGRVDIEAQEHSLEGLFAALCQG
ncbi:uroporphyrinogen-III synthase [Candidatus Synechococcus calcipolaris]